MSGYVFIGSEATAHYSGNEACTGAVVSSEVYGKYESILSGLYNGYSFMELDGKHSEVEGSVIIAFFDSLTDVIKHMSDIGADLEDYILGELLYEYQDNEEVTEEEATEICQNSEDISKEIKEIESSYERVTLHLSKKDAESVRSFVDALSKASGSMKDTLKLMQSRLENK